MSPERNKYGVGLWKTFGVVALSGGHPRAAVPPGSSFHIGGVEGRNKVKG
jgi:hypothetical protein